MDLIHEVSIDRRIINRRIQQEGLVHDGIEVLFSAKWHCMEFAKYSNSKHMMVYGQTEITHDFMDNRTEADLTTFYKAKNTAIYDFDSNNIC